jgi:geranylgeranyl diphosphate synthase type II
MTRASEHGFTVEQLRQCVEERLQRVPEQLSPQGVLCQIVAYVVRLPGKRMRPLLCMLASGSEGASPMEALEAAVALELFHAFTLVHDDIMDRSLLRRGQPTVHHAWGEPLAILAGDVLLGLCYRLLERYREHPGFGELIGVMNSAVLEVSEGQALDLELPQRQPRLEEYWRVIEGKTVALLQAALEMGAIVGHVGRKTREQLQRLGFHLGRAFQVQDDVLDLTGTEEELGKPVGQDLREGKLTYPVIRALELAPEHPLLVRYRQQRGARPEEIPAMVALLDELGTLQEARQLVAQEYAQAMQILEQLPQTPAQHLLRELIAQLEQRSY